MLERNLSVQNTVVYAKLIKEKSLLRQLITTTNDIADLAYSPGEMTVKDVIDSSEQAMFKIAENFDNNNKNGFEQIDAVALQTIKKVKSIQESGIKLTGKSTGWADLDNITSGLHDGELVILAARPSMGKTALALNIAQHVGIGLKKNVAMFSLEMPKEHLTMRMLSSMSEINYSKLKSADLSASDWAKIHTSTRLMKNANIFIDDEGYCTPSNIRFKCRRLVREKGEIEQDADVILFIYRHAVYAKDEASKADNTAEIIIGKQRNGPVGTIKLTFQSQYTRFESYVPEHDVPFFAKG